MRLGLDFGTTRTVVSYADRGNYPVVGFPDEYGDMRDFVPSVAAIHGGKLVFGFEALAAGRAGAAVLRSFKRLLADPGVTPATQVAIGDRSVGLLDLVSAFFAALHDEVTRRSTLVGLLDGDEPLEVVAGVPAHAYAAQRFLTIDALRRGGFRVAGLVNEPSAASFEYTHRQARAVTSKRNQILVYDLGGGTFDASLIRVEGTRHEVVSSLGVNRLGGDDFDAALLECALEEAGTAAEPVRWSALLDEAREAKERISPQSRRITLDLSDRLATVMVDDFYARATPLVEQSVAVVERLLAAEDTGGETGAGLAGIYIVGGGSGLPLVARHLRERFGRRVHRSAYPGSSTAIGLAIASDAEAGYSLADRLSRGFGVFRELRDGAALSFDPLIDRDAVTSGDDLMITRRYRPAHNLGRYRYVEYTNLGPDGDPHGDVRPFAEVAFPYDRSLRDPALDLTLEPVRRTGPGPLVEERYTVDPAGLIEVRITDLDDGYEVARTLYPGS